MAKLNLPEDLIPIGFKGAAADVNPDGPPNNQVSSVTRRIP